MKYELNDMNMATTYTQSLVTSHFLIPRLPQKSTMLLILTVDKLRSDKKHPKNLPKFVAFRLRSLWKIWNVE